MRILFSSLRETSHFLPLVPYVKACLAKGHEVAVAAPSDLAERAGATGAQFFPLNHLGDEGLRPLWASMHGMSQMEASAFVIKHIFSGKCAEWALPSMFTIIDTFKPDVLVREALEYSALIAGEKRSLRSVRVGIIGRHAEEQLLTSSFASLDQHRTGLGLTLDPTGERVKNEARITLFPPSLDRSEAMGGEVFRFRAPQAPAAPLPDHWPTQSGPFVYVTLGTVAGRLEANHAMYRTALAAVASLPVRVLLTIGHAMKPADLGEIPGNVHVEAFVPQDDVLPHAAAVICHGGSGTMLGALAAGVPQVVCPMFADQPFNAQSIADAGAGLALPLNGATVETLRAALMRVLDEPTFRTGAQRLASEMAAAPLLDEAPATLARLANTH